MPRINPVGRHSDIPPIPPVMKDLRLIPAGPVAFGVEYRTVNPAVVDKHMENNPSASDLVNAHLDAVGVAKDGIDDGGVCVHVFDRTDVNKEYLRFDAFHHDPHYHYIHPGEYHVVVGYDHVANGDYLSWICERLDKNLPDMLAEAGAEDLASQIDRREVDKGLSLLRRAVGLTANT